MSVTLIGPDTILSPDSHACLFPEERSKRTGRDIKLLTIIGRGRGKKPGSEPQSLVSFLVAYESSPDTAGS